jgi:hypothetical protein
MNRHGQDVGGRVRNLPSAAEANHEEPRRSGVCRAVSSAASRSQADSAVRFPSSAPETDAWSEALFLERPGLMAINCGRRIAGVSQSWRWRLGHRSARACRPGLFVGRVEIRNTSGAGARRAIRTAATTELIRRPENCHPRRRPADSLMADDGVRRIRLFHICDLVLGQSDGEGADGSFQMRNLRCPDDRGRHRLLL